MPGKHIILLDSMTKKDVDVLQSLQKKNRIKHNIISNNIREIYERSSIFLSKKHPSV